MFAVAILLPTLGDGLVSTLCGPVFSTLGGHTISSLFWRLLQRLAVSFLTVSMSFHLSAVKVGTHCRNIVRKSVAALTVLLFLETVEIPQWAGDRQ
jgi:hypothetical protein